MRTEGLVSISQGNHDARFRGRTTKRTSDTVIYHFPVRSTAQFRKKIVQGGGRAQARTPALTPTSGWHWRRWHRYIEEGRGYMALAEALPNRTLFEYGKQYSGFMRDEIIQTELAAQERSACSTMQWALAEAPS